MFLFAFMFYIIGVIHYFIRKEEDSLRNTKASTHRHGNDTIFHWPQAQNNNSKQKKKKI